LLDRGSTISMLAPSCPGIKPSSVRGANWRAQRGLAHRVSTSAPPGQMTSRAWQKAPRAMSVNLSAAWPNGALNAARRSTRWKAVFDVAGPAFIGSVPTSTAVSGRGGGRPAFIGRSS
jgi:hypothetical protein